MMPLEFAFVCDLSLNHTKMRKSGLLITEQTLYTAFKANAKILPTVLALSLRQIPLILMTLLSWLVDEILGENITIMLLHILFLSVPFCIVFLFLNLFQDNVAGPELKTQQIYNQVGKSITESVLDGYNGTIFMYGQTTSGKTYTMLGTPDAPGILPCAVRDVFLEINKVNRACRRIF